MADVCDGDRHQRGMAARVTGLAELTADSAPAPDCRSRAATTMKAFARVVAAPRHRGLARRARASASFALPPEVEFHPGRSYAWRGLMQFGDRDTAVRAGVDGAQVLLEPRSRHIELSHGGARVAVASVLTSVGTRALRSAPRREPSHSGL